MTARNFGPIMAMAARVAVALVHEVVELGELIRKRWSRPGCSCNAWSGSNAPITPAAGLRRRMNRWNREQMAPARGARHP